MLRKRHLQLAHQIWKDLLTSEDIAIDATCGNGHDTLFLAKLQPKKLYAIDIQQNAINLTRNRLGPLASSVHFLQMCHSTFPKEIENGSVKLIVYNLGYLPGGDKAFTTLSQTTLQSVNSALSLLSLGGILSITCYPGHFEGEREEDSLQNWASQLDASTWSVLHYRWLNRVKSPSLMLIQKHK